MPGSCRGAAAWLPSVESPSLEGFRRMQIRYFGTWFSRHGGVGLAVGLDDLGGLYQP